MCTNDAEGLLSESARQGAIQALQEKNQDSNTGKTPGNTNQKTQQNTQLAQPPILPSKYVIRPQIHPLSIDTSNLTQQHKNNKIQNQEQQDNAEIYSGESHQEQQNKSRFNTTIKTKKKTEKKVEKRKSPTQQTQSEEAQQADENNFAAEQNQSYANKEGCKILNKITTQNCIRKSDSVVQEAIQNDSDNTQNNNEDSIQDDEQDNTTQPCQKYTEYWYSNQKSGSFEINAVAGYQYNVWRNIYIGCEIEGGPGFNFINNFKLDSKTENTSQDINLQSDVAYGYVTPKFTLQVSKFIIKVGPRLQFISLYYKDNQIDIFNISLQVDILAEIIKEISAGIKVVWSPMNGSRIISNSKKDNLECKCGDISVLICLNGQYKHKSGCYFGSSISAGWKASKVNLGINNKQQNNTAPTIILT